MPSLPLNGFTVLDLTAHRAGLTAVRQLADWGADVIKIEQPGEQTDATGRPIHMSAFPQPDRLKPTPDQGQHTDEILQQFGYDAASIAALHLKGAV